MEHSAAALYQRGYQVKVSKKKLVGFISGIDRSCCFYTTFGDMLISGGVLDGGVGEVPDRSRTTARARSRGSSPGRK